MNNPPQTYDAVIAFIDARIESITRNPISVPVVGQYIDRGAINELKGVKAVCQQLNNQERLIAGLLNGKKEAA